jgi:integrase/recombinase XerD
MSREIRLYLPFEAWPKGDRTHWERAFRAGTDPFDDHGPAAHLAERTRLQLQYAYGKFLAFLLARHPSLLARPPAERVNRKIIEEYAKWQPATCGGITLSIYIYHLWLALHYIYPTKDWAWLLVISKRLAAGAKKKPAKHSLVTSEILYRVGTDLMDCIISKTQAAKKISITDAMHYRNGLLVALPAAVPLLRRRTLAALRIGKHLVRAGDLWTLDIPAEDFKTKRPQECAISAELSAYIDLYLNQFRPRIPGSGRHDYLWASNRGRPMRHEIIYVTARECTRRVLGFPVNLHRFRHAAGTFWSIRDPANVRGVKDLLGHASFATTERHYIMAKSRVAGRALARAIGNVLKGPAAS